MWPGTRHLIGAGIGIAVAGAVTVLLLAGEYEATLTQAWATTQGPAGLGPSAMASDGPVSATRAAALILVAAVAVGALCGWRRLSPAAPLAAGLPLAGLGLLAWFDTYRAALLFGGSIAMPWSRLVTDQVFGVLGCVLLIAAFAPGRRRPGRLRSGRLRSAPRRPGRIRGRALPPASVSASSRVLRWSWVRGWRQARVARQTRVAGQARVARRASARRWAIAAIALGLAAIPVVWYLVQLTNLNVADYLGSYWWPFHQSAGPFVDLVFVLLIVAVGVLASSRTLRVTAVMAGAPMLVLGALALLAPSAAAHLIGSAGLAPAWRYSVLLDVASGLPLLYGGILVTAGVLPPAPRGLAVVPARARAAKPASP
jgi:hypothetical protein